MKSKFRSETAAINQIGGRAVNEDTQGYRDGCWVVADGLGGHGGGDMASKIAVECLLQNIDSRQLDPQSLLDAFVLADQAIIAKQQDEPRLVRMRTTAVVLSSDGYSVIWGHIGDSRLYHLRDGHICFQTYDHSVPQYLASAGEIKQKEVRFHEDRNKLLRCLGSDRTHAPVVTDESVSLANGDVFLLCTDGFWEYVTEADMEKTLAQVSNPQDWLQAMTKILNKRTPSNNDNYTAVAVFFRTGNTMDNIGSWVKNLLQLE